MGQLFFQQNNLLCVNVGSSILHLLQSITELVAFLLGLLQLGFKRGQLVLRSLSVQLRRLGRNDTIIGFDSGLQALDLVLKLGDLDLAVAEGCFLITLDLSDSGLVFKLEIGQFQLEAGLKFSSLLFESFFDLALREQVAVLVAHLVLDWEVVELANEVSWLN